MLEQVRSNPTDEIEKIKSLEIGGDMLHASLEELYTYKQELLENITTAEKLKFEAKTSNPADFPKFRGRTLELNELKSLLEETQAVIDIKQQEEGKGLTLGNTSFPILDEEPPLTSVPGTELQPETKEQLEKKLLDLRNTRLQGDTSEENLIKIQKITEMIDALNAANDPSNDSKNDIWERYAQL